MTTYGPTEALDLFDVVPSPTPPCLSLQCTACGWTRHLSPGGVGGRALAHIVDIAEGHARDVDHGHAQPSCTCPFGPEDAHFPDCPMAEAQP